MAISYPYSTAFLADLLDIESVVFDVERNDSVSGQGSGRLIAVELAPPLWYAEISLNPAYHEDAEVIAAKIRRLHGSMGTFYLYDPRKLYPASDPDGSIIGARTPSITEIGSDNQSLTIGGFPAGYVLTPGDKMSFAYGTSSRGFLEVSDYSVASLSGLITDLQVFPHVPIGTTVGVQVNFVKPVCRMAMDKGGWSAGTGSALHTTGGKFRAKQKV